MNINERRVIDPRYTRQQRIIQDACGAYGLVAFRPNYHAQDRDCNTVLIYRREDADYNRDLAGLSIIDTNQYRRPVFTFENTDANGRYDLGFANRGKLDLRVNDKAVIMKAIKEAAEK